METQSTATQVSCTYLDSLYSISTLTTAVSQYAFSAISLLMTKLCRPLSYLSLYIMFLRLCKVPLHHIHYCVTAVITFLMARVGPGGCKKVGKCLSK